MEKEELKKIIVEEIKRHFGGAVFVRELIADNILAKIPKEVIIASGIVSDSRPPIYDDGICIGDNDVNDLFDDFIGKKVCLTLEEMK